VQLSLTRRDGALAAEALMSADLFRRNDHGSHNANWSDEMKTL